MYKHILYPPTVGAIRQGRRGGNQAGQTGGRTRHCLPAVSPIRCKAPMRRSQRVAELQRRSLPSAARNMRNASSTRCERCRGGERAVRDHFATSRSASQAIIEIAGRENCDLIVMASHGRRGLEGFCWEAKRRKS